MTGDQQPSYGANSPEDSGDQTPIVRKVSMLDPGFREIKEASVLRPRILGLQKPKDPNDQRNVKYLGLACLVALLIFGVLEYKQLHDAAREAKKSVFEYLKLQ